MRRKFKTNNNEAMWQTCGCTFVLFVVFILVFVSSHPRTNSKIDKEVHPSKQRLYEEFSLKYHSHGKLIPVNRNSSTSSSNRMLLLRDLTNAVPASSPNQTCLATYGNLRSIHHIVELSTYWNDSPVSIALYAADGEAHSILEYLQFLTTCYERIKGHFDFSLLMANPQDLLKAEDKSFYAKFECDEYHEALTYLLARKNSNSTQQLPVNELRNIAQNGCSRLHVDRFLSLPLGTMPKPRLDVELAEFVQRTEQCPRCVFVLPTFYSSQAQVVPSTKAALDALILQRRIVAADEATYKSWKLHNEGKVSVAFEPAARLFQAYVAPINMPKTDSRLNGEKALNTQLIEAYLKGYRFRVLANGFVVKKVFGLRISHAAHASEKTGTTDGDNTDV